MPKTNLPLHIKRREVTVKNLNTQPEKSGDNLVPRCDLSIKLLITAADLVQMIRTRETPPSRLFWTQDGKVQLRDMRIFTINLIFTGSLVLETMDGEATCEIETATFGKLKFKPLTGVEGELECQLRFDPTNHLEALMQMRIDREAYMQFEGSGKQHEGQGDLLED